MKTFITTLVALTISSSAFAGYKSHEDGVENYMSSPTRMEDEIVKNPARAKARQSRFCGFKETPASTADA